MKIGLVADEASGGRCVRQSGVLSGGYLATSAVRLLPGPRRRRAFGGRGGLCFAEPGYGRIPVHGELRYSGGPAAAPRQGLMDTLREARVDALQVRFAETWLTGRRYRTRLIALQGKFVGRPRDITPYLWILHFNEFFGLVSGRGRVGGARGSGGGVI